MKTIDIGTVEQYVKQFPEATQNKLNRFRSMILACCPDVEEKISWGAPTYYYRGYLLQIAAYQKHIGFYTSPEVIALFRDALSTYKTNHKNTMQIPIDQELPEALIKDMILAQVNINKAK